MNYNYINKNTCKNTEGFIFYYLYQLIHYNKYKYTLNKINEIREKYNYYIKYREYGIPPVIFSQFLFDQSKCKQWEFTDYEFIDPRNVYLYIKLTDMLSHNLDIIKKFI